MLTEKHRPVLIVIAGPNGSGKTTITSKILRHEWLEDALYANPDSDIDVAVIVPTYGDRKMEISKLLWHDVDRVSFLIEPVLMAEDRWSPLYDDVMRTGVLV